MFEEQIDVDDDLVLNRASFDAFGDVLFVIIGNAAKYGSRSGLISVLAASGEDGSSSPIIAIEITSRVDNVERFELALDRINNAMSTKPEDIERAAVQEGFTGLRKAVGIVKNVRSPSSALAFYADKEKLEITFAVYMPANISTLRGR